MIPINVDIMTSLVQNRIGLDLSIDKLAVLDKTLNISILKISSKHFLEVESIDIIDNITDIDKILERIYILMKISVQ